MHDGSLLTLDDVGEFYNKGGIDNENKSPLLAPLKLDAEEKTALVAFMKTLTGDNTEHLVSDARTAPVTLPVLDKDPADIYMESVLGEP
jgi:cytochrome c peroxidase